MKNTLKQIVVLLPYPHRDPLQYEMTLLFFSERVYIDKKAEKLPLSKDKKGVDRHLLRMAYLGWCKEKNIYPMGGQSFAHACRGNNISYWGHGVRLRGISFK